MAHILMVLDHTFPPDVRVENEAFTLAEAGFEVTVLSIGPDDRDSEESADGYRIVRVRIPAQVRNKMRGLSGTVPLLDVYLRRLLTRLYRQHAFDVIHAHDLYLFGPCLRAGRKLGIPVVGDMHENWVDVLRYYHWSTHYPGKLVINLDRWDRLETEWCLAVDRLVVVIEEMADRLEKKGVQREKLTVVPNTIRTSVFGSYPVDPELVESLRSELTLVYTGGMNSNRGLETTVEAMPSILEEIPGARLILVGDGAVRRDLEALVERLGLHDSITFTGWQSQDRIPSYIAGADIGLMPHLKTIHTDHTIPHKLFHYMYMGIPVVSSDCRPAQRIIESENAGLVFGSGNIAAFASCIVELAREPGRRQSMGKNGKSAVANRYNWDATSKGLVSCYRQMFPHG